MVEAIRSCLANLPLIGGWFASASTSATSTAGTSSTSAVTTDADCVRNIAAVFVPASAVSAATSAPAITPAIVQYCTNLFGQIQSPVAKMQAFAAVQNAVNSTDAIVKEFYDALPAAEQEGFKLAMYNKNQADTGNGSVRNGHDHGLGFGDYMVYHEIKTDLAKEGAIAYIAALQAAASSTATSTTGTV